MDESLYLTSIKARDYNMYLYFMRGIEVVARLNEKMYEAYLVGGVVRDYLMNVDFKDIDIATSATPEQVLQLFPMGDATYAKYGCITLREGPMIIEITTFRTEEYRKSRKAENIHYSKRLVDDVMRRDFTVNALAMTSNLSIVDVVDGRNDVEKKIVRVIGNGVKRFKEDPLRMLRGLNLVARYHYTIHWSTARAMAKASSGIAEIAQVKLSGELSKILSSPYGKKAVDVMVDYNLFKFLPIYRQWLKLVLKYYQKLDYVEKFTLLYRIMGKIPDNVIFHKEMLDKMNELIEMSHCLTTTEVDKMMIYTFGAEKLLAANRINIAYSKNYHNQASNIKKLDKRMIIRKRNDMNISAQEIIELLQGETNQVGVTTDRLIHKVVMEEIKNHNAILRQEILQMVNNREKVIKQIPSPVQQPVQPKKWEFHQRMEKEEWEAKSVEPID